MLNKIGRPKSLAFASAAGPHGYHSTGLLACCWRYGLDSSAKWLGTAGSLGLGLPLTETTRSTAPLPKIQF